MGAHIHARRNNNVITGSGGKSNPNAKEVPGACINYVLS
jgi:hypothetical protein